MPLFFYQGRPLGQGQGAAPQDVGFGGKGRTGRIPGGQTVHHRRPLDLAAAPAPLLFDPAIVEVALGKQGHGKVGVGAGIGGIEDHRRGNAGPFPN